MSVGELNAYSFTGIRSTCVNRLVRGLAAIVVTEIERNPADRCLYIFCNRGRDKIKLLIWHLNGYWCLYKRVEKQRFQLPDWFDIADTLELSVEELDYFLDGYNLNGMRPHRALTFARHF